MQCRGGRAAGNGPKILKGHAKVSTNPEGQAKADRRTPPPAEGVHPAARPGEARQGGGQAADRGKPSPKEGKQNPPTLKGKNPHS